MARLHCTAIGNPVPEITWIKDGKTVDTGDMLSFTVKRNHSGKYWCTAKNVFNAVANASAYLDVLCKYEISNFNSDFITQNYCIERFFMTREDGSMNFKTKH